jgi:tryptophan 7-halogenase
MIAVNSQTSAMKSAASDHLESIVVIGGSASGWLAAAALARVLKPNFCSVRVIESQRDSTHGGSQAVLPSFHRLNSVLGINEHDLLQNTRGSYRLGAEFIDWGRPGERYFHTYGSVGAKLEAVPFHHYWMKLRALGDETSFDEYSTASVAASRGRFSTPLSDRTSMLSTYSYGYHFHEDLLAAYLKQFAQAHGAIGVVADIVDVSLREYDGFIEGLRLADGAVIRADLYIDCSGEDSILSRSALKPRFEDWSRWLPCNRTLGFMTATADIAPYSQSTAQSAGWSYRVPLQGSVHQGYVYSADFCSNDEALQELSRTVANSADAIPRVQAFTPGKPHKFWDRNYLLLAVNCVDPLESTALHLVQTGISRLLALFPVGKFSPHDIDEYNRITDLEYWRIRDFLVLHFKASTREDSSFWHHCRSMELPDTLLARFELFKSCGRVALSEEEHFGEESWLALYFGQGVFPERYDPLADVLDVQHVQQALAQMRTLIGSGVSTLPTLSQFIDRYCSARGRC